jgi:hypothetical protein
MSRRIDRVSHQFTNLIPDQLEEGVVHISVQYRVAVHLCPCGCRDRVVTPFSPVQWSLLFDGETVSLNPSIAGVHCNAHYFITGSRVRWVRPLTQREREAASHRDAAAAAAWYQNASEDVGGSHMGLGAPLRPTGWWRRFRWRVRRRWPHG